MFTNSPAVKTAESGTIYYRQKGSTVVISDGKNAEGKWHIIDIAMGNVNEILQDLQSYGKKIAKF